MKRKRAAFPLEKIISGGQTGADIAALRAAKGLGIATGGKVPFDYDAQRASFYRLERMAPPPSRSVMAEKYERRSKANVDESDGTLAFRTKRTVGTDKTIAYALHRRWYYPKYLGEKDKGVVLPTSAYKPVLLVDDLSKTELRDEVRAWVVENNIRVLNVCGRRDVEVEADVYDAMMRVFNKS